MCKHVTIKLPNMLAHKPATSLLKCYIAYLTCGKLIASLLQADISNGVWPNSKL